MHRVNLCLPIVASLAILVGTTKVTLAQSLTGLRQTTVSARPLPMSPAASASPIEASPPIHKRSLHAPEGGRKNQISERTIPPMVSPDIPQPEALVSLVRNTLITLNDANISNNYNVLYQLSSPEAKKRVLPETLAESFRGIREQGTDLSIMSVAIPKFSQMPQITPKGLLRLKGTFESSPTISFDLFYEKVSDQWRIYAIGVGIIPVDSRPHAAIPINLSLKSFG